MNTPNLSALLSGKPLQIKLDGKTFEITLPKNLSELKQGDVLRAIVQQVSTPNSGNSNSTSSNTNAILRILPDPSIKLAQGEIPIKSNVTIKTGQTLTLQVTDTTLPTTNTKAAPTTTQTPNTSGSGNFKTEIILINGKPPAETPKSTPQTTQQQTSSTQNAPTSNAATNAPQTSTNTAQTTPPKPEIQLQLPNTPNNPLPNTQKPQTTIKAPIDNISNNAPKTAITVSAKLLTAPNNLPDNLRAPLQNITINSANNAPSTSNTAPLIAGDQLTVRITPKNSLEAPPSPAKNSNPTPVNTQTEAPKTTNTATIITSTTTTDSTQKSTTSTTPTGAEKATQTPNTAAPNTPNPSKQNPLLQTTTEPTTPKNNTTIIQPTHTQTPNTTAQNNQPVTLQGNVISNTQSSETIIKTPIGNMTIPSSESLPKNTNVNIEILQIKPAGDLVRNQPISPNLQTNERISEFTAELLKELTNNIMSLDKTQGSTTAQDTLPNTKQHVASKLLWFLSGIKQQSSEHWLGRELHNQLKQLGSNETLSQLDKQFQLLKSSWPETNQPQQWQQFPFPVYDEENVHLAKLYWQNHKRKSSEDPESNDSDGARFIVEVELSDIGQVHIDGLLSSEANSDDKKQLNMELRSTNDFNDEWRSDLLVIFSDTLEALGLVGHLSFRTVDQLIIPTNDDTPQDDISESTIIA